MKRPFLQKDQRKAMADEFRQQLSKNHEISLRLQ